MTTNRPKIRTQVWVEMLTIGTISGAVAYVGEPKPFALAVAGLGALTLCYVGAKELDR